MGVVTNLKLDVQCLLLMAGTPGGPGARIHTLTAPNPIAGDPRIPQRMPSDVVSLLRDVDAYMFDVFGTTVDWFTTVKREVARRSNGAFHDPGASRGFRF